MKEPKTTQPATVNVLTIRPAPHFLSRPFHAPEDQQQEETKENKTGLPDILKAGIEDMSGISMGDVKVLYNSAKPAGLSALAYTQGTNIHVGPGQERHLPHEAWHVVQQKQGRVKQTMRVKELPVNDDENLEKEADLRGQLTANSSFNFSSPYAEKSTRLPILKRNTQTRNHSTVGVAPIQGIFLGNLEKRKYDELRKEIEELTSKDLKPAWRWNNKIKELEQNPNISCKTIEELAVALGVVGGESDKTQPAPTSQTGTASPLGSLMRTSSIGGPSSSIGAGKVPVVAPPTPSRSPVSSPQSGSKALSPTQIYGDGSEITSKNVPPESKAESSSVSEKEERKDTGGSKVTSYASARRLAMKATNLTKSPQFKFLGGGVNKRVFSIEGSPWLILVASRDKRRVIEAEIKQILELREAKVHTPNLGVSSASEAIFSIQVNGEERIAFLEERIQGFEIPRAGIAFTEGEVDKFGTEVAETICNAAEFDKAKTKLKAALESINLLRKKLEITDIPDFQVRFDEASGRILTLDPGDPLNSENAQGKHLRWLSLWEKVLENKRYLSSLWNKKNPNNKKEIKDWS